MGELTYNGVSSASLGLVIQAPPLYEFPEKDVTVTHIPGVNGDIILDNETYKNVERTYSLACSLKNTTFATKSAAIVQWLTSGKGYCKLSDTYEPDVFRQAIFLDAGSLTNYFNQATVIPVTFRCKPQRYLNSGDSFVTNTTFNNTYNCNAYPIFKFKLNANTVTITLTSSISSVSSIITFTSIPSDILGADIYFDTETLDAYCTYQGTLCNLNGYVTITQSYPKFVKGETTTVSKSASGFTEFYIKPRWCKI